ncbi:hypothetical protein [Roseibium aggregatum]|uniref:hypothetical protein n=1 Tax=Roseibium aggregatum TaxID=187304 RepID=UPI0025AC1F61|nr:hypothetical protein [Roseibium aggregatum]WJS05866.1 hypothetical protein QUB73_28000 [Roseibium aggregatum]
MMRLLVVASLFFLIAFQAPTVAANAGWSGNWDTTYGQLRLKQDGNRVYGDYAERGTIEGWASGSGNELRAVYMYSDGRWGLVRWTKSGDRISGFWNWSADGIPPAGAGKSWTGKRTSLETSGLRYAKPGHFAIPDGDPQFVENDFAAWLRFTVQPSCCTPPPNTAIERGRWHRGYRNALTEGVASIGIDITHNRHSNTGAVDISIYVPSDSICQPEVEPGFCEELLRMRGADGHVPARVTGQRIVAHGSFEQFLIAFRLPGDGNDRLMAIQEGLKYSTLRVWSRHRGLDLTDVADPGKHLCDSVGCSNRIPTDLAADPHRYLGALSDIRWAERLIADGRSSGAAGPESGRNSPNERPASNDHRKLTEVFGIFDERGKPLGAIRFQQTGRELSATGELIGLFGNNESSKTEYRFHSRTDEAVSYTITAFSGQSGERRSGRIIVELPSSTVTHPRGTMVVDDEVTLINLKPAGSGDASETGGDLGAPREDAGPEDDLYDQPGFGIYKYTYKFRDVPSGRTVKLRDGPSRKNHETAMLRADAVNMQIMTCDRDIDNIRFEEAARSEQLETLARLWCKIVTTDGRSGWLPARYLVPEQN